MDAEELIDILDDLGTNAPPEIWTEARDRWFEIRNAVASRINLLLEERAPVEHAGALSDFAVYIAADLRDTGFLPTLLKLFRASSDLQRDLLGDMVTEEGANLIVAICPVGSDISLLWEWLNEIPPDDDAALLLSVLTGALFILAEQGNFTRSELLSKLRQKLTDRAYGEDTSAYAWIISTLCDAHESSLTDVVEPLFKDNLVDDSILDWPFYLKVLSKAFKSHPRLIYKPVNSVDEFKMWKDVQAQRSRTTPSPAHGSLKIGRNDPCPCGSGKKHKKCCGKA